MINFQHVNNLKAILSVIPETRISNSEKEEFLEAMVLFDEFMEHIRKKHNVDTDTVKRMLDIVIDNAKAHVDKIDIDKVGEFKTADDFFIYAITNCCTPVMLEFAAKQEYPKIEELERAFIIMIKVSIITSGKFS